jgi:hypothetical protein
MFQNAAGIYIPWLDGETMTVVSLFPLSLASRSLCRLLSLSHSYIAPACGSQDAPIAQVSQY